MNSIAQQELDRAREPDTPALVTKTWARPLLLELFITGLIKDLAKCMALLALR